MKKNKLLILLVLIITMLPMVEAKISITYNDTTNNTTQYISNYNDYKSFIIQDNDKYLYDGTSLESSTSLGLTKSGLLNVFEFNASKNSSGDTYLFTGLKYWTMTSSSGGKYVIDPSTSIKYKSYSETSNSGARYTQYIMDCTQTIGDGSLNNPWQLVKTDDCPPKATTSSMCFAFNSTTGTITDYYYYENNVSTNPACPRDVIIPSKINGVAVTIIGDNSFNGNQLTSISIPNSVTNIKLQAFIANKLTDVVIPNGVKIIADSAFRQNQLTSVTIPASVTSISTNPFSNNPALETIIVDSGNPNYISVNNGLYTKDGKRLVTGTKIGSSNILNTTTTIGGYAFLYSGLTSLSLPDSVTNIEDSAFAYNQITSATLGNSLITIGSSVFYGNKLTSISFPSTLKTIGFHSFGYNQLTSVTIPNSVTTVDTWAFMYNKLTSVTLGNNVTRIGDNAFAQNQLTSITIPSSVTIIGDEAFGTNKITSVTIPSSVTSLGINPFEKNPTLTSITIDSENPNYFSINNGVYTNDGETIIIGTKTNSNNILSTITIIGDSAFSGMGLTSVTIPNNVTIIGQKAFESNSLTSVTIPNSVTLIETWTFCYNYITQGNFQIDNISGGVTIEENILLWNGANKGVNTITPTYLR